MAHGNCGHSDCLLQWRVDLDDHVKQLRDGMKEMRDETREGLKETNKRLDQVLAVLASDKKV